MPLNYQEFSFTDFSGGITDKYIDVESNEARELDNYVLSEIGKPLIRTGYKVLFEQDAITRIMGMFLLNEVIFAFRNQFMYEFDDISALTQVPVPNVGQPFFQNTGSDIYPATSEWRDQLVVTNRGVKAPVALNRPMLVYKDDFGLTQSLEAGLPDYPDTLILNPITVPAATFSYLYRVHYSITYKVDTTEFKTVGFTRQYLYETNTAISVGNGITLSNFDAISSVGNQMDVSNIKTEIYRTENNGVTFYKIQERAHDAGGSYLDENLDSALPTFETIYTTGGVRDHVKPPMCKYAVVVNDIGYYANVIEELDSGDIHRPYRFVQSHKGNVTGVMSDSFSDVDDEIMGVGAVKGLPLIFTKSYIYRTEGVIDSFGNGSIRNRVISDTIGCVSHNSIINVGQALLFAGNDGFYVTDGYEIKLVKTTLVQSYREIVASEIRAERIHASYDNKEERVYWSCADNDTENNKWFILNLKTGGFTTGSGKSFLSTTTIERNGSIMRGDELGYIYEHKEDEFDDLIRDVSSPVSAWENTHIPFKLTTISTNFGSSDIRKWVASATVTSKTDTTLAIKPISMNDDGEKTNDMKEIRLMSTYLWADPNFTWGDPAIKWRVAQTESKQRHFPRSHARCIRKQVSIEPVKTIRFKSDLYAEAVLAYVDPLDPTRFTLTLPVGSKWPINIVNDQIKLGDDDYFNPYNITIRSDQTITCVGGGSTEGVGKKWHIIGFNRQQRAEIKGITIKYALMDREGTKFQKEEAGENS